MLFVVLAYYLRLLSCVISFSCNCYSLLVILVPYADKGAVEIINEAQALLLLRNELTFIMYKQIII